MHCTVSCKVDQDYSTVTFRTKTEREKKVKKSWNFIHCLLPEPMRKARKRKRKRKRGDEKEYRVRSWIQKRVERKQVWWKRWWSNYSLQVDCDGCETAMYCTVMRPLLTYLMSRFFLVWGWKLEATSTLLSSQDRQVNLNHQRFLFSVTLSLHPYPRFTL